MAKLWLYVGGLQSPAAVIAIAKDHPNVQNPILYRANNVSISIPWRQETGALQGFGQFGCLARKGVQCKTGVLAHRNFGLRIAECGFCGRRQDTEFRSQNCPNADTPIRPPNPEPGELVLRGFCPAADIHSRVFQNLNDTENKQRGFH
jgi:hypothetical protein